MARDSARAPPACLCSPPSTETEESHTPTSMSLIDPTLGPGTAMSMFDPNRPDIYVDTIYDEQDRIFRAIYGGCSCVDLHTRAKTNDSQASFKTSPYLSFLEFMKGQKVKLVKKYAPFQNEQDVLDHFGLENLLNVRRGGGGRRSSVDWKPDHLDALHSGREIPDLEAEYGIGSHQWNRLRTRIADRQDSSCWYPDMAYVKSWKIGDLRRYVLLDVARWADANGVPGIRTGPRLL